MNFKKQKSRKHNLMATSIMMLFVIMLSLSTATFAWFSANTIVGTNTIGFTAEHTAQADVSISWLEPGVSGYEFSNLIDFGDAAAALQPAIPNFLPNDSSTFNSFKNAFYTATINRNKKFNENGQHTTVFASTNPSDSDQNYFYVHNNGENDITLKVYLTWEGDNDNLPLLRVALFVGNIPTDMRYLATITAPEHKLTWIDEENDGETMNFYDTHYGDILMGKDGYTFNTISTSSTTSVPISGESYKVFAVVAWFDGVYLDEYRIGYEANIILEFEGVATEIPTP